MNDVRGSRFKERTGSGFSQRSMKVVDGARTFSMTKAQPGGPWITGKSDASLGEAATGSFLESRSPDVIQRTRFPPERSERMLKDKHRFDQINHVIHGPG